MKTITHLLFSLVFIGIASCQEMRIVKVTATEEDGTPIEGVDTTITFMGHSSRQTQRIKGQTDASGVFQASGRPNLRMYVKLDKDGYYTTISGRLSRTQDHDLAYVLRKIESPIPLYAKKFRGKVPKLGVGIGFDFKEGDWVAPHGSGKVSDVIIHASMINTDRDLPSGLIRLTFLNKTDGVFTVDEKSGYMPASQLVMPHSAPKVPDKAYALQVSRKESGYENNSKPRNTSYFFRTRSKEVLPGKFVYNYSKLQAGFSFVMGGGIFLEEPYRERHPQEYGLVEFTYYFNPTPNDRNLEFDPKRNLFTDLDPTEQVHDP